MAKDERAQTAFPTVSIPSGFEEIAYDINQMLERAYRSLTHRLQALDRFDDAALPPAVASFRDRVNADVIEGATALAEVDRNDFQAVVKAIQDLNQAVVDADLWWRRSVQPHLLPAAVDMDEEVFKAREARAEAETQRDRVEQIRSALETVAEAAATLKLATIYDRRAKSHAKTKWIALAATGILAALLAAGGWALLAGLQSTDSWTELTRDALARAFVLGAASYAVVFASKVYRQNAHLQAVYEQKASALTTFNLFDKTITDPSARIVVLGELVKSVFSSAETGVLDKTGDHTVVESALPIASILARSSK